MIRRLALLGGFGCLALLPVPVAAADVPAREDPQGLLARADHIKSADYARFVKILARLDAVRPGLSLKQQWYLKFLQGWQADYRGNVDEALQQLREVMEQHVDSALRFRAMATSINVLDVSHRYDEAFVLLNRLLDLAPKVSDPAARFQGFGEAAQLLIDVGHYDLASSYIDLMLARIPPGESRCKPLTLMAWARYKSGDLDGLKPLQQEAVDTCVAAGEDIFANRIRADQAEVAIRQNEPDKALALLEANYPAVERTQFRQQLTRFSALMARAYWRKSDVPDAEHWALAAVDVAARPGYERSLAAAYRVLYQLDSRRGNYKAAMGWLLKYTQADRDYLDDVHARALAYEMVRQQVRSEQMRLDMQRALDRQTVETSRLYVALLLVVLFLIAWWLVRLKRSQRRLRLLAQRDGLTGILNHPFFVQQAEQALLQCRCQGQPVGLIVLDLDHFTLINDMHGHAVGDDVLREAVRRTQEKLHPGDIFGRLGGEEFAILLVDHTLAQALMHAEAIREAIEIGLQDGDPAGVEVSASLGVADSEESGHDLRRLLADADLALYRAKRLGRNRVVARAG